MAAVTLTPIGPPIRWGNAAGKAIIAETLSVPASTAGDTATITCNYVANFLQLLGNGSTTATPTNSEAGCSVPVKTLATVASSNVAYITVVGFARDAAPA